MISQTWNGVVQDKTKEAPDEHVCCEEHDNDLVQLLYSFKDKRTNKITQTQTLDIGHL